MRVAPAIAAMWYRSCARLAPLSRHLQRPAHRDGKESSFAHLLGLVVVSRAENLSLAGLNKGGAAATKGHPFRSCSAL